MANTPYYTKAEVDALLANLVINNPTDPTDPTNPDITEGDNGTVITANQLGTTTVYWNQPILTSDLPMFTFQKDVVLLFSTDHDNSGGGIHWAEMDDLEFNGLTYGGLIDSGNQMETPWGIVKDGVFHIFMHTGVSDEGNNPNQSTHLLKSSGGSGQTLSTATWTRVDNVLGVVAGENHLGYTRVYPYNDATYDYIAHHLAKSTDPITSKISGSTDLENWTRIADIDVTENMPDGMNFNVNSICPFDYNGEKYGLHILLPRLYTPSEDVFGYIAVSKLNDRLLPSVYMGNVSEEIGVRTMNAIKGSDGYVYANYKGGGNSNTDEPTNLWIFNTARLNKSVELTSPVAGTEFEENDVITIQTQITGTPTLVEYFDGNTKIGERSSAPFNTLDYQTSGSGNFSLSVKVTYDDNLFLTSDLVTVSVPAAQLQYILDSYPMEIAYSTRKVKGDYSGNLFTAWKNTGTEEELQIGFDGDNLDEATLDAFKGSTDVRAKRWYNQGSSAETEVSDFDELTTPLLVKAGTTQKKNNRISLRFDGSEYYENNSESFSRENTWTAFVVCSVDDLANFERGIFTDYNSSSKKVGLLLPSSVYAPDGTDRLIEANNVNEGELVVARFSNDGQNTYLHVKGVLQGSVSNGDAVWSVGDSINFRIGHYTTASTLLLGNISELLIDKTNFITGNDAASIEQNINIYFNL